MKDLISKLRLYIVILVLNAIIIASNPMGILRAIILNDTYSVVILSICLVASIVLTVVYSIKTHKTLNYLYKKEWS